MAQTGYTPISIYYSSTASATPTAGNLVAGELAINTADGKLFYKDSAGVVQTIASKGTGTIGGSTTQVQYNNAGAFAGSANFVWDNTNVRLGIGTSSPQDKLSIVTTANSVTGITVQNLSTGSSATSKITCANSATSTEFGILGASYGGYGVFTAGSGYIYPTGNSALQLGVDAAYIAFGAGTGAIERMRIDAGGNVIIGSTSAVGKFTVIGGLSFLQKNAAGTQEVLKLDNSDTTAGTQTVKLSFSSSGVAKGSITNAVYGNGYMAFATNDDTEKMRINAGGSVNIGSTTVSNGGAVKLFINGGTSGGASTGIQLGYDGGTFGGGGIFALNQGGGLQFYTYTGAAGSETFTERMSVSNAGNNLVLAGGTANATGTGITFPATQVASSNLNCLDDYEEGTWTPTITASGTAPTRTYNVQDGVFVKIGKQVTAYGRVQLSSISGGTGNAWIEGLPFSASSVGDGVAVGYVSAVTFGAGYTQFGLYINQSVGTSLSFSRSGNGVSADNVPIGNLGAATDITFCATYFV